MFNNNYHSNVNRTEIDHFSRLAHSWWQTDGEMATLHAINPTRVDYIEQRCTLPNKKLLDVGCGGGILSESLARLGAKVTGIDLAEAALQTAQLHAHESKLTIDYRLIAAEALAAAEPGQFDIITCFEMLEHVPDPASIINACAQLTQAGGDLFFSTLNRTPKAWLTAIVGAEYVLRLLPRNTHHFRQFIRPAELANLLQDAGLTLVNLSGLQYNPLTKMAQLTTDVSVNYLVHARKL